MNSKETKRLVAESETATIEFKRARGGVSADLWSSYSTLANADGGTIVLGVRENARKFLYTFAETSEADIPSVAKRLGSSVQSVRRTIHTMKEVGLLVREGGDNGGKWIVKKA